MRSTLPLTLLLPLLAAVALVEGRVLPKVVVKSDPEPMIDDVKVEPVRFNRGLRHKRQEDFPWADDNPSNGGRPQNVPGGGGGGRGIVAGGQLSTANNYGFDANQAAAQLGPPPPRPDGLAWPSGVPRPGEENAAQGAINNPVNPVNGGGSNRPNQGGNLRPNQQNNPRPVVPGDNNWSGGPRQQPRPQPQQQPQPWGNQGGDDVVVFPADLKTGPEDYDPHHHYHHDHHHDKYWLSHHGWHHH